MDMGMIYMWCIKQSSYGTSLLANSVVVIPIPWQFHIRFLQIEIQFPLQTALSKWHFLNSLILYYGFTVKSVFIKFELRVKLFCQTGFGLFHVIYFLVMLWNKLCPVIWELVWSIFWKKLLHAVILSPNLLAEICLSLHYNCSTWHQLAGHFYSTQSNCMLLDETLV